MMLKNQKAKIVYFVLTVLVFLIGSCDLYKEKTYDISGADLIACKQFEDSVFYNVSTVNLADIDTSLTHELVPNNVKRISDSLQQKGNIIKADQDTAYLVTLSSEDTTYILLETEIKSFIVFCTRPIGLNLLEESGEFVPVEDDIMPLETVSGCQVIQDNGQVEPRIKFRRQYKVKDVRILLQLFKTEQTKTDRFNLTIK